MTIQIEYTGAQMFSKSKMNLRVSLETKIIIDLLITDTTMRKAAVSLSLSSFAFEVFLSKRG